jgi:hypothetical protein
MGLYSATVNPHIVPKVTEKLKPAEDIANRKRTPGARKKRIRRKGEPQKSKNGKLELGRERNTSDK